MCAHTKLVTPQNTARDRHQLLTIFYEEIDIAWHCQLIKHKLHLVQYFSTRFYHYTEKNGIFMMNSNKAQMSILLLTKYILMSKVLRKCKSNENSPFHIYPC